MSLTALSLALAPVPILAEAAVPEDFVDLAQAVPAIRVDPRYYGSDNFIGARIDGYDAPKFYLTRPAAVALARVQAGLQRFGLGLKTFDCYRPARAVAHFARWARDKDDIAGKAAYYPDIDKADLFSLGYLAERSGHSRGSTVDLTIVDLTSGDELDMGSPFDLFSPLSWPSDRTVSASARGNRLLLQSLMQRHGFDGIDEEWWHFTLRDEPYPDTYFDFPIR